MLGFYQMPSQDGGWEGPRLWSGHTCPSLRAHFRPFRGGRGFLLTVCPTSPLTGDEMSFFTLPSLSGDGGCPVVSQHQGSEGGQRGRVLGPLLQPGPGRLMRLWRRRAPPGSCCPGPTLPSRPSTPLPSSEPNLDSRGAGAVWPDAPRGDGGEAASPTARWGFGKIAARQLGLPHVSFPGSRPHSFPPFLHPRAPDNRSSFHCSK